MESQFGKRSFGWSSSGPNTSDFRKQNEDFSNFAFSKTSIRNGFIQKVFTTVTVQLAVTVGLIALFQFNEGAVMYAYKNPWMMNLAMMTTLALTLLMGFSTSLRRQAPLNLIILGAYTVSQAFLIGLVSSFYEVEEVFLAATMCASIVFGLSIYAKSTKEDFTIKGGMLVSALMALTIGSLISIFYRGELFNLLLSVGGAAVFSMYVVYDLQMIMGDRTLSISGEEYIFAALNLYVDIIRIFMELLKILRYINEANGQNQRNKKKRN